MNETKNLNLLMYSVKSAMEDLNYSVSSIKHYTEVWKRYLKSTDCTDLDEEDIGQFLKDTYGITDGIKVLTRYQRGALRAMNVLVYFSKFGKIYIRFPLTNPVNKETAFDLLMDEYMESLKACGCAASTTHSHGRVVQRFLHFLNDENVTRISDVDAGHITGFILEITGHRGKATYELNNMRVFFHFLYRNNLHPCDLSLFVPASNHLRVREHLPSVWQEDDIHRILQCIDTGNPVGKRDFAIILLAVRLGLRGSDIKKLQFRDINWTSGSITVIQSKTKEPLVLPLFEDIGNALIDYLKSSRPVSDQPYVFLSLRAPYAPLPRDNHLHHVLNKYIRKAGVIVTVDKSHGMHSLRHYLASKLLKQGTPLPVISGILGHKDTQSTSEYLRVDIDQLRFCTLEVEVQKHV